MSVPIPLRGDFNAAQLRPAGRREVGHRRPERIFGLFALATLEHRERRRSGPVPGPIPRRHPPGRLPASATEVCFDME
jgi:hypothetical protein